MAEFMPTPYRGVPGVPHAPEVLFQNCFLGAQVLLERRRMLHRHFRLQNSAFLLECLYKDWKGLLRVCSGNMALLGSSTNLRISSAFLVYSWQ